ncbi:uncharacterized protein LOC135152259 [Daucus carota subsp. sativus]|uniref:uncharacterized protein LOC135152259 n=1 Tax=Daucus carota subsp. sativus TaxID=79200 RepID=UPI003083E27F
MRRKTKAGIKMGTPTSGRKLRDEEDLVIATVDSDSGGEESGVQRSEKDLKRAKVDSSEKEKSDNNISTRKIILGKPLSGKAFFNCGVVKLFSALGFESLIVDLPKIFYPSLVREFYLNLHVNPSGQIVSFVSDTKITLSPMFLNAIIQAPPSPVSIHTKRGFKHFDDFQVKDQFKILFGVESSTETFPSTTQILPLAHAVFKVSIENLCPRLGTRSNLSAQDVIVVSMIMAGKPFDVGDLILNNMLGVLEGKSSAGLPYGLLLTRIFEWFGVSFDGVESVAAKEFLDVKCLSQSNLKVEKDGSLSEIMEFMDELRDNHKQLVEGQKLLSEQMDDLANQFQFWKDIVFGGKTGNTPEKVSSVSFVHELQKRMYGSGGSSDMKFTFTSTDDATDSPRPRTAMDALKEAAGTDSAYADAGNLMMEENRVAAELTKKFAQETPDKDDEET